MASDGGSRGTKLSKSSLILLVITGFLLLMGVLSVVVSPDQEQQEEARNAGFDLQGHRGARGLLPENSLPAFERAIEIGVTTIELDVGLTRDGVVVVHHDRRLNAERARGGDGQWLDPKGELPAIVELTYDEIRRFDIGRARPGSQILSRHPDQQALEGVWIPRLDEVIEMAEGRSQGLIRYNIETKISPEAPEESPPPEALVDALVTLLRSSGIVARSTVQSFDWRGLQRVQTQAPEIATTYLTVEREWLDNLQRGQPGPSDWTAGFDLDDHGGSVPQTVKAAGGARWSPHFRDLRPSDLEEAHGLGLDVVVWTVNEADDMAALIDAGVDGIISDYPDRLLAVLEEKGFRFNPATRAYDRPSP